MPALVSVIVPMYNAAEFVRETLDSIVASNYRPIEVVVVDDGSKDNGADIVEDFVRNHPECRLLRQTNSGVSAARNHAIREAKGKYILPVDADDKISSDYIRQAVAILEEHPEIRICGCKARMFGAVNKEWKVSKFSHSLLARRNMIPVTSMFRRDDWEKTGGFCEEDIYREDWDFWLSMMELGGDYHRLDEVGLYYRVQPTSRRKKAKSKKKAIVDAINRRHPAYMQQHLGGPLHYHRSWSKWINLFRKEKQTGEWKDWNEGEVIHHGRNTLRRHQGCVIKQFATPTLWRGILYGLFTPSKAQRSYEYALHLGELTPAPIAYKEVRVLGILRESWYVCQESECPYTFNELIGNPDFPHREQILQAIGRFTAQLHQRGIWHRDYSGGNILFNADGSKIQIVDLNRIRFCYKKQPRLGFERLNIDREALTIIAHAYAIEIGMDPDEAAQYIIQHRWHKHVKQGITNL